ELGQPVQGGFVGPVHVLDDHEHGPWPRNLVEERGEDLLARRACEQTRREWPADRAGDVVQRAQRAGRDELVARAPEQPGALAADGGEIGDEGRLAIPASSATSATRPDSVPACRSASSR